MSEPSKMDSIKMLSPEDIGMRQFGPMFVRVFQIPALITEWIPEVREDVNFYPEEVSKIHQIIGVVKDFYYAIKEIIFD